MKSIKYLLIIQVYMLFFSNLYSQEKIKEIKIKGNINVKTKEIVSNLKVKKNDYYSHERIKNDIQSLIKTGYFDDVIVNFDTNTYILTFTVKEKPKIKKIDFKGNRKISSKKLNELLEIKEDDFYDEYKIETGVKKMTEEYKNKGYADIRINYDYTEDKKQNYIDLIFFITEGKRILIGDIKFTENKFYKSTKLIKLLKTKKNKVYNEETFKQDIDNIIKFYKDNGFESINISTPIITFNSERTYMFITIKINEGPRYKIEKIKFDGNKVYTDKELKKVIVLKEKHLYNEEKLHETILNISELYGEKGYLKVEIKPEIYRNEKLGLINMLFKIKEGNIIYIDRIYIDGNYHTKEYVIRRELLLKENDPLITSKLRRSIEKIFNLGFLDDVNTDIQNTPQPDRVDLLINVLEGKPGMISAGAGYSSVDKLVGTIQLSHLNLFGRAQKLNLLWEFGERRENYSIGWTDPWFLQKNFSFGVNVYDLIRQRDLSSIYNAYKEQRHGGEIKVGPRLTEYLNLLFSYTYEKVRIFDINDLAKPTVEESENLTSSFLSQITYDTRNNIFDASKGNKTYVSLQFAGGVFGGDVNFFKTIFGTSWFFPTIWKFVFSINSNFGFITQISNKDIPIYEKFFVGGAETVRGYEYRELGPLEGGNIMTVFNAEYKFPIAIEKKRTIVQGAFFYDVGGSWENFDSLKLEIGSTDEWKNSGSWDNFLKSGFGFGIRFTTPVFPIRLDWGWPVQPVSGRSVPQFYFTIGQIF